MMSLINLVSERTTVIELINHSRSCGLVRTHRAIQTPIDDLYCVRGLSRCIRMDDLQDRNRVLLTYAISYQRQTVALISALQVLVSPTVHDSVTEKPGANHPIFAPAETVYPNV